jgi:glutamyl-tRNA synthetase
VEEKGVKLGVVAQATRVALTGRTVSPPLFEIMALLGREKTLARLLALVPGVRGEPSARNRRG